METKDRILEQATTMFLKHGIRSITMDEIAESLGISKRTLYESFATKEDLLRDCIEYKHRVNLAIRDAILAESPDDPLEVIRKHFRQALLVLNSMHPNFLNDIRKYHSGLWQEHIASKQEENIAFTHSLIEKGIETGVFMPGVDAEILSRMVHSSMQFMTLSDVFPESRFPRAEVARQVMLNFIRGMATPKGIAIIDEQFKH